MTVRSDSAIAHCLIHLVYISPLVVKELKRIVESSEIVKYVQSFISLTWICSDPNHQTGKMTQTGPRRTSLASKRSRFALGLIISPSK